MIAEARALLLPAYNNSYRPRCSPAIWSASKLTNSSCVAIAPGLLKRARSIAARRGRSVSALLADELRELVAEDRAYEAARQRAKALLTTGFSLQGVRMHDRDALHDRRRLR